MNQKNRLQKQQQVQIFDEYVLSVYDLSQEANGALRDSLRILRDSQRCHSAGQAQLIQRIVGVVDEEDQKVGSCIQRVSLIKTLSSVQNSDLQALIDQTQAEFSKDFRVLIPSDLANTEQAPINFLLAPICEGKLNEKFQTVLFYQSQSTCNINVCKLSGIMLKDQKVANQTALELEPPQIIKNISHQTSYPLLMYKSPQPMDNFLHVVNLAVNSTQLRINIYPYRFLQFVQVGLASDPEFKRPNETAIYFLARHLHKNTVRLMYYRTNPWRQSTDQESESWPSVRQNNIQLISGELKLPSSHTFYSKAEVLLLQKTTQSGIKMVLIIQYESCKDSIWCCHFGSDKEPELVVVDPTKSVVSLKMQLGPNNTFYFVQRDDQTGGNYQIIGVSLELTESKSKKIEGVSYKTLSLNIIYSQPAIILAWQIRQDQVIQDVGQQSLQFFIFDEEKIYKRLGLQKAKFAGQGNNSGSQQLLVLEKIDFTGRGAKVENMCAQLHREKFPTTILGQRIIVLPRYQDYKTDTFVRQKTTMMVHSNTSFNTKYLHYFADKAIKEKKGTKDNSLNCVVLSIEHMNWIGKHFAIVREDKMSYFETYKSPELKRVDFMDYQQQIDCIRQIKVLDQYVAVEMQDFSFLFDAQTGLLVKKQEQQKSKLISDPINGTQFVIHKKMKKPPVKELFKYTLDGQSTCISSDYNIKLRNQVQSLEKSFKSVDSKRVQFRETNGQLIDKFVNENYCFKVGILRPNIFVSKEGKLVQVFIPMKKMRDPLTGQRRDNEEYIVQVMDKDYLLKSQSIKINVLKTVEKTTSQENELVSEVYALVGDIFHALLPKKQNVNTIDSFDKLLVQMTDDYLVLICFEVLLFVKLVDIDRVNDDQYYIEKLHLTPQIPVKVLDLSRMLDLETIDSGLQIIVQNTAQSLNNFGKQRENKIQITTIKNMIYWDIDKMEEFGLLADFDQFISSENEFVKLNSKFILPKLEIDKGPCMNKVKKITQNQEGSLFCIPRRAQQNLATCFTLFSNLDVQEWHEINKINNTNQIVRLVEKQSVTAEIYGMSIFQFFSDQPSVINAIREQAILSPLRTDQDTLQNNIYIRQIFHLLQLPLLTTLNCSRSVISNNHQVQQIFQLIMSQCRNNQASSQIKFRILNLIIQEKYHQPTSKKLFDACVDGSKRAISDILFDLLLLSKESNLTSALSDCQELKLLFNVSLTKTLELCSNSLVETEATKKFTQFSLQRQLVVGSNTTQISEEDINQMLMRKQIEQSSVNSISSTFKSLLYRANLLSRPTIKIRPVKLCVVDLRFFRGDYSQFLQSVAYQNDAEIFENDFVKILIKELDLTWQIFFRVMVPYFLYMFSTLYYLTYCSTGLNGPPDAGFFDGSSGNIILRVIILISTVLLLLLEITQMRKLGLMYFSDFWNWLQIALYCSNLAIVIAHVHFEHDLIQLSTYASFASIGNWVMILFYWMRLFKETSFYVLMITETMTDIGPFLVMYLSALFLFANAFLILDISQTVAARDTDSGESEYDRLIPESIDNNIVDAVLNQYLISLGNFTPETYPQNGQKHLIWLFFLVATVFTNINFLNLLIAIISDTYDRITENRNRHALMQRTEIFADFIQVVSPKPELKQSRYLFIMSPLDVGINDQDWEGSINALKRQLSSGINQVKAQATEDRLNTKNELANVQIQLQTLDDKVDDLKVQLRAQNDELLKELRALKKLQ